MPKGEIVGMFTGRVCLSLMASSDDGMSTGKKNNNDGMIIDRVCNQISGGIA
jgi:hypothetical protein